MLNSDDDFGLDDDDDTIFLAAATQVECTQPGGDFAGSPRPLKKQRLNDARSDEDQENRSDRLSDNGLLSEDDYLSEARDEEQNLPKSKYKIHVPRNPGLFEATFLSQTQTGLDSDLGAFRGAIWKKPSAADVNLTAPANGFRESGSGPVSKSGQSLISNLFTRTDSIESDAQLARRLQAEERDKHIARQQQNTFKVPLPPSAPVPTLAPPSNPVMRELQDLPPDAFSSSPATQGMPTLANIIDLESESLDGALRRSIPAAKASQTNLKQTTIFGQTATPELNSSGSGKRKNVWPLKARDEKETHHKLDQKAMETWIYPTNLGTIRDYQFNIVKRSLFYNTLVALPTGLGKTFIAATVMLNYYRWTTDAQIVFMAPTKPLIAQQMEACYHIVGIPRHDTVLMTGESTPAIRSEEWRDRRVFFMTPQTVINDLKTGICDPKRLVLVVVDEAHKATGGYAYTEVVKFTRRFNDSFRVLALTATPGSKVEAVQAVIENLDIARVELRTEASIDIQRYTHEKHTETELFSPSEEQALIMELVSNALRPTLDKLNSQNAYWSKDPMSLTAFGMNQSRQKWNLTDAGRKAPMSVKGMVNSAFTVLSQLAHGIGLLKYHGIGPFSSSVTSFQRAVDTGETKGKIARSIIESKDWVKMMGLVRTWTANPDFIGHPKLEYLREVVLNHFLDAGEGHHGGDGPARATRVMIFASFRDSTEEICRVLKRSEPMIRAHHFVGQTGKAGSEGMNQKKQNEVVQDFKTGKYNTLVATSIGEEGLDIGDVDLIICYDSSASPIRMLQRIGRTGRKRLGKVVLLLMKGKEENDYAKAQDSYRHIQKSIADVNAYEYCEDRNRRILPLTVDPVVDKKVIEIPIENTQPIDLNERARRARGKGKVKRPPKKFHMPDGVRTGFVKASRLGSDGEDVEDSNLDVEVVKGSKRQAKVKIQSRPVSPEPLVAQFPYLQDVLLSVRQQQELEQKYALNTGDDDDENSMVAAPDITQLARPFLDMRDTKYVEHGRFCRVVEKTIAFISTIDDAVCASMGDVMRSESCRALVKSAGNAGRRLASANDGDEVESHNRKDDLEDVHISSSTRTAAKPRVPRKPQTKKTLDATTKATRSRPAPKSRGRGRAGESSNHDTTSYGYEAGEGIESSPDATPAEMRLATQGIDLGSQDTSEGDMLDERREDDEDEVDSDLEDFVARSDEAIEMVSSSLPHIPGDSSSAPVPASTSISHHQRLRASRLRVGERSRKKVMTVVVSDVEERSGDGNEDDDAALRSSRSSERSLRDDDEEDHDSDGAVERGKHDGAGLRMGLQRRRVIGESDDDE